MRFILLFLVLVLSSSRVSASVFACYGKEAVGIIIGDHGEHIAKEYTPKRYFAVRLTADQLLTDRFPNPLSCLPVEDTRQIVCTGKEQILHYDRTEQRYSLTLIRENGNRFLEAGTCSWVTN